MYKFISICAVSIGLASCDGTITLVVQTGDGHVMPIETSISADVIADSVVLCETTMKDGRTYHSFYGNLVASDYPEDSADTTLWACRRFINAKVLKK
jgi:hypothetical protein